jgi:hypothetical protein
MLNWDMAAHFQMDQYGFLEWGDNTHYDAISWIPNFPWRILWNGNYYGLDFTAFEQYYHTGDLRFLEYGIAHSHHVHDVHMCHFGPGHSDNGSSRYCPPAYHINVDDPPDVLTNRTANPSHHKTEAMWQDYYMTGNDYALEVALQGATWFNNQGTTYASTGEINTYIRRWAHDMFTLECAYIHTRSVTYLNNIVANWEAMKNNIRNNATIGQEFMVGLGMEAVVKLYPILSPTYGANRPDSITYFLKVWGDRVMVKPRGTSSTQINTNVTLAYAFLSRYSDISYRDTCYKYPPIPFGANLHKDFAQQGRNLQQAMYYLAIPESLTTPTAAERKAAPSAGGLSLTVSPSPLAPMARIALEGDGIWQNTPFEIRIFSADGRLIRSWNEKASSFSPSVIWDAQGLASGLYVVRCRVAGREAVRTVPLLK